MLQNLRHQINWLRNTLESSGNHYSMVEVIEELDDILQEVNYLQKEINKRIGECKNEKLE